MGGGVVGGHAHGGIIRPSILDASERSTKLWANGERGVTRGDDKTLASIVANEEGRLEIDVSLKTRVDGAGERFAKGSSSNRSEGGEFRGDVLLEGSPGLGTIGIAGGNTKLETDGAAE